MAQSNWTYYSLTGLPYLIEMYHGDDSGHLILFINGDIILIDFNQTVSKTYSFLVENQVLEFKISEEEKGFKYEVIPQLPQQHKSEEKIFTKHFWIPLIMLIIALNLLYLIMNS